MTPTLSGPGTSHASMGSLNFLDIIFNSSPIVMAVLILLLVFSLLTWAIIYYKWRTIGRCEESTESFLEVFWSGRSMDHIYSEAKKFPTAPVARIFQSGYKEFQRLIDKERERQKEGAKASSDPKEIVPPGSSLQNLERALSNASRNETMKLESSMTFLATAASTAPFIGLFGTVWGIMSAFQNIGAQGGASLAVVAPGIAEALVATAVGLFCAIPATMGYNYYIHKIRHVRTQMENFAADFLNIVRRNFLTD